ncbi:MAG: UPF0182 family protein, partial [Bryobacteraceae bacterium]
EARMPQLKKIVLAEGNSLIYTDTYEQALAQLAGASPPAAAPAAASATPAAAPAAPQAGDPRVEKIRGHLRKYRELASQGKWAEAGRELEALEAEATRR